MTLVKICGIVLESQGMAALEAGADMLGFVFAESPRRVEPEAAAGLIRACRSAFPVARRPWLAVGVFANQELRFVQRVAQLSRLDAVQLSGREAPEYSRQIATPVFKAVHLSDDLLTRAKGDLAGEFEAIRASHGAERLLLDSGRAGRLGGTGENFDWSRVGTAADGCIVAGGLTPSNVAAAIAAMRPWAVDVSSGVETAGRKDPALIRAFITNVRRSSADVGQASGR